MKKIAILIFMSLLFFVSFDTAIASKTGCCDRSMYEKDYFNIKDGSDIAVIVGHRKDKDAWIVIGFGFIEALDTIATPLSLLEFIPLEDYDFLAVGFLDYSRGVPMIKKVSIRKMMRSGNSMKIKVHGILPGY